MGTSALHLPFPDNPVDRPAYPTSHWHISAGQADFLRLPGGVAFVTGAVVEVDEDFGCGDDSGRGMASVVLAGSARVARTGVYGSGSSSERLGAVVEVHPIIAGDG